jgi:hypothetical protein
MPKLHYISQKFLKEQGYRECLANSQRIQRQDGEEDQKVNNTNNATCLGGKSNNNQQGRGESLLKNGNKQESNSKINTKMGVKRKHPNGEEFSAIETNQNSSNDNLNGRPASITSSIAPTVGAAPSAAVGASVNLQRRNQNIIWVRIGATDHPAFELYNPDNPDNNDSSTVWVQYTSNGINECVSRSQITRGLQDRKRNRPNYYN